MAVEKGEFNESNDSSDGRERSFPEDDGSVLDANEHYGKEPDSLDGVSAADDGNVFEDESEAARSSGEDGDQSRQGDDGEPAEPRLPKIGRITILGDEWEHETLPSTANGGEESETGATGADISGIEVTGSVAGDDQRTETEEPAQAMDPGPINELDDAENISGSVSPEPGTLGDGDPGAIDTTDSAFADMFGIKDLAPAATEPSVRGQQAEGEGDDANAESADQDEARVEPKDRRGHIEMQELHLKSVQEGISWELFSDGVLSRLGVNDNRDGAVQDVEGAAQLDKTFTPSLRSFHDGRSGEVHQRLSLAAIAEVDPEQGVKHISYVPVGNIDHFGILHPQQGVSSEDAQAVHEKAERLLAAKRDGFLPDLEDNLLDIRNPYTGIMRA